MRARDFWIASKSLRKGNSASRAACGASNAVGVSAFHFSENQRMPGTWNKGPSIASGKLDQHERIHPFQNLVSLFASALGAAIVDPAAAIVTTDPGEWADAMEQSLQIEKEMGVPVLSKIPFLKRLFTNRSMAKDEQILLILVRPTIIIQREVEQRQFPLLTSKATSGG